MRNRNVLAAVVAMTAGSLVSTAWGQSLWQPLNTPNSWNVPENWSPAAVPNGNGVSVAFTGNLAAASTVTLDAPITVGSILAGDPTTAFFGYTIAAGTGGTLTFENTSGPYAYFFRGATATNNANDTVSAPMILNSNLVLSNVTTVNSQIRLTGAISGTGNLVRTVIRPDGTLATGATSGLAVLTNVSNSYTGITAVTDGILQFQGNVLLNANSAVGNASTPIYVGTSANSFPGAFTSSAVAATPIELRMAATDDTSNYTVERGLDFSGAPAGGAPMTFRFSSDFAGGINTNKVTLTGPITLNSTTGYNRNVSLIANRSGMSIDVQSLITGGAATSQILVGETPAAVNATDGPSGAATYRFSNVNSNFAGGVGQVAGTLIVAGDVPLQGNPSPLGIGNPNGRAVNYSLGTGGNIISNIPGTAQGQIRSFFMETGGTTMSRLFFLAGGTNTSIPAYGNQPVGVVNGFAIGQAPNATNLSSPILYEGQITFGVVGVGTTNDPTSPITNKMLVPGNLALMSANGGTVVFTGTFNEAGGSVISSGGSAGSTSAARVTINQFRNNPYLDIDRNGTPDTGLSTGNNANEWIGTPTNGLVTLLGPKIWTGTTHLRGGTLLVNGTLGSATVGDTITVDTGATLGGIGTINAGLAGSTLQVAGTLNPGDPAFPSFPGQLFVNKSVVFQPGSAFTVDIGGTAAAPAVDTLVMGSGTTVTLDASTTLNASIAFEPNVGSGYKIIDLNNPSLPDGVLANPGFGGLPQNALIYKSVGNVPVALRVDYRAGFPNYDVSLVASSPVNTWAGPSAPWTENTSWTNPAGAAYFPNNGNQTALFGTNITDPAVVALNSPITVGNVSFTSPIAVTLDGTGSLTLQAISSTQTVALTSSAGNHTIAVPVNLVGTSTVSVSGGSSLTLLANLSASDGTQSTLVNGELVVAGATSTLGNVTGTGTLNAAAGVTTVNAAAIATVEVGSGARLNLTQSPTNTGVSVVDSLVIDNNNAPLGSRTYSGFVDVTNNGLVISGANSIEQAADLATTRDQVRAWTVANSGLPGTSGLGTSLAFYGADNAFITLAVYNNDPQGNGTPDFTSFNGVTVDAFDTLVKYTYIGDTNLDGVVDATDLTRALTGLNGGGTGWNFGDVNYDGVINFVDLGRIQAALRGQGAPLGNPALGGGGAIPEPAGLALLAPAGLLLGRRRRQ